MNQSDTNIVFLNGRPTKEELQERIENQLKWRGPTDTVALIWHGYLTALLEWGAIEAPVFNSLTDLLPIIGNKELHELSLDEPISAEKEIEMDEQMRISKP